MAEIEVWVHDLGLSRRGQPRVASDSRAIHIADLLRRSDQQEIRTFDRSPGEPGGVWLAGVARPVDETQLKRDLRHRSHLSRVLGLT